MPAATATIVETGGLTVLEVGGDLTAAAMANVESCLDQLLRRVHPRVVIDLSRVRHCDATGATILNRCARRAASRGGEIRLAAPPGGVCGLLRDGGLMRSVRTYGSLDGAMSGNVMDLLATPDRLAEGAPFH